MNKLKSLTKLSTAALSAVLVLSLFSSCKKDSSAASTTVSEATAADAISQSISGESGGMSQQSSSAVVVANTEAFILPCGETFDSSISASSLAGAAITYSFNLSWQWTLSCSNLGIPQQIDFNMTGSSMYDAPRISSDDNSTGSFTLTGLGPTFTEYTMNTNYVRNGTEKSKVLNENSFTSTITITSTDIKIDKITQLIKSGTATASITGTSFSGIAFSYSGTIVFLGNKKATLTMASGKTYDIAW